MVSSKWVGGLALATAFALLPSQADAGRHRGGSYGSCGSSGGSYGAYGSGGSSGGGYGSGGGSSGGSRGGWMVDQGWNNSYGSSGGRYGSNGGGYGSGGSSGGSYGSYGGSRGPVYGPGMNGPDGAQPPGAYGSPAGPPAPPVAPPPPRAMLEPSDSRARFALTVPDNAIVYMNRQRMTMTGTVRHYVTPQLEPGREYRYPVRVGVVRNGVTYAANAEPQVQAGQTIDLIFKPVDQPRIVADRH